ncbi:hypothetical protein FRB90_000069 [Tulasnella sp. 427]|nr:hypothetical protein FRB90_000069 [Tulasnella sp. 427]
MKRSYPSPTTEGITVDVLPPTVIHARQSCQLQQDATKRRRVDKQAGAEARAPQLSQKPMSASRRRLSARFETSKRRASAGRPSGSRSSFAKSSAKRRQSGSHALNASKALDSSATFFAGLDPADWMTTPDDYTDPLLFPQPVKNPSMDHLLRPLLPHQVSSQRLSESELRDRPPADQSPKTPSKEREDRVPRTPLRTPTMSWSISPSDTLFRTVSRETTFRKSPSGPASAFSGFWQATGQSSEGCIEPELPRLFSMMCGIGDNDTLANPSAEIRSSYPSFV